MTEMRQVPFYRHHLGAAEKALVAEVIDSLFLTTGPKTAEAERAIAAYMGVEHCLGVMSATAALFLCLKGWGIGEGDEVITTPMTFIASSNTVLHAGAKPVFVDVEPDTGNMDAAKLEAAITPRTKAIMPVHLYGQLCDMKAIRAIADRHGLKVVEDCAHAFESMRDGVQPGQLGDAACFSFYATKNVACGEGGAVVTRDPTLMEQLRLLRLHGMSKSAFDRYTGTYKHWDMVELGYKANMFDLQAALLLPQFPGIAERLERREKLAAIYDAELAQIPGVERPAVKPGSRHARHLYTIWVPEARRDEVLQRLQARGIGVAVNFRAVHLLSYYAEKFGYRRGDFPVAERIGDRTISLPMYPNLPADDARYVASVLADVLKAAPG
jgi:UDP-4-amino-4-deoxy-L-arabinose-oxoglutarate aminotransferase